jgi:NADP-dependent 3-hydroxy acid dehydrogenase YdfG
LEQGVDHKADATLAKVDWKHGIEDIRGKAVVITGGTTGIGRATALLFAAHGAKDLTFGRHQAELDDALRDIRSVAANGGEVHGLTADTSKQEDIRRVFEEADRTLGGVDILVNNAAVAAGSITDSDYADLGYILRTNVLGYMACAKEALQRMTAKGRGHVVCTGFMSADVKEAGSDVYVATKTAIAGFCDALRKQVNEKGIKVTLVEPGKVGANLAEDDPDAQKERQSIESDEMLTAEDIAECIYYCVTQPWRCEIVNVEIRPHKQII